MYKIINYRNGISEDIIDNNEKALHYIRPLKNVLLRNDHLKKPPAITSRLLSDNCIAIKENNKWTIKNIK